MQDQFTPFRNFTIAAGLRYDNYKLFIQEDAFSPRIAMGYYIPRTQTTLSASYNRFFQFPPAENLLLASSAEPPRSRRSPWFKVKRACAHLARQATRL